MGVEVTVLRPHAWRQQEYEAGATYVVEGDGFTTEAEYLDTLERFGLAKQQTSTATEDSQPAARSGKKKAGAA